MTTHRRRRRSPWVAAGVAAALAGAGVGYVAADVQDMVPGPLTARPLPTPAPPLPPAPGATVAVPTDPVLEPVAATGGGDAAAVAAVLDPLLGQPALGPTVSVSVTDVTGELLYQRAGDQPRVPASTVKLLTAAAALSALGPASTLDTVVVDGPTPQEVVLVGGGDVLLAAGGADATAVNGRAGLGDLAARTAAQLLAQGRTEVAVRVDDSRFSGSSLAPSWSPSDVGAGYVAPVTALAVDAGRAAAGRYAPRHADPTLVAASAFSAALTASGVTVVGEPVRASARADAAELARVSSAPVAEITAYMLAESDNTVAEALARLVAAAQGHPATFEGASAAVLETVEARGVPTAGAVLTDGSGLGTGSRLPADLLTEVLALGTSPEHPDLRPLVTGLPVAGFTGTMAERFDEPEQAGLTGLVRAKTGSLTGVTTLAGVVPDARGRLVLFAVLADQVADPAAAREAVDRLVSALASCACG